MPTVGLEYRYPFINVQSWGTQTIEPIAQLIVRPNETDIGKLPNEDSQSLIFDASNLFRVNKYAGWDRVEGGGRAECRHQYTAQFNRGGFVNVLFGQSYQLFGQNSFAVGGPTNTGIEQRPRHQRAPTMWRAWPTSRTRRSRCTSRFRFERGRLHAAADRIRGARPISTAGRTSVIYGNYAAQPALGLPGPPRRRRRQRQIQGQPELADARRRSATTCEAEQVSETQIGARLYRRLPHLGPELHHRLFLQFGTTHDSTTRRHAPAQPAHARRKLEPVTGVSGLGVGQSGSGLPK